MGSHPAQVVTSYPGIKGRQESEPPRNKGATRGRMVKVEPLRGWRVEGEGVLYLGKMKSKVRAKCGAGRRLAVRT